MSGNDNAGASPAPEKIETMAEVCKDLGITMQAVEGAEVDDMDDGWRKDSAFGWTCIIRMGTLKRERDGFDRRPVLVCSYWQGMAHAKFPAGGGATKTPNHPELADVMASLVGDAQGIEGRTFEEWASDYGYDTDSRKAHATYEACSSIRRRIVSFMSGGGHSGVNSMAYKRLIDAAANH